MQQARRSSHLAVPRHLERELPRGIAFDLLMIEVAHGLGEQVRLGDQMAVAIELTERGFGSSAALWLVREGKLGAAVAAI